MKTIIITGMPGCGMRQVGDKLLESPSLFGGDYVIHIQDVGNEMYKLDIVDHPPPQPRREEWEETIFDRPPSALATLRKTAFQTIISQQISLQEREERQEVTNILLVFVHATFFWRHDVQIGMPFASVEELEPDFLVTIVDDLKRIARNLYDQKRWRALSLEEILWWRAVETTITAEVARGNRVPHYVLARDEDIRTLVNLIRYPPLKMRRVYTSYPISYAGEEELKDAEEFVRELREDFIVFDPRKIQDVEYGLEQLFEDYDEDLTIDINEAGTAELTRLRGLGAELAQRIVDYRATNGPFQSVSDIANVRGIGNGLLETWGLRIYAHAPVPKFRRKRLESVRKQLDHQCVARDYDLIDQSDFIAVYYAKSTLEQLEKELQELAGKHGEPAFRRDVEKVIGIIRREEIMPLSAGVICEMQYAYTHHKPVYAVWKSQEKEPSPFFAFYCTKWTREKEPLLRFLRKVYGAPDPCQPLPSSQAL